MIKTISKITVGLLVLTLVLAFTSCNSIGYNPSSVACLNFYAFVPTEYQISEDINVITINGTAKDKQIQSALETQRRAELLNKSRIENIVPPQSPVDKGMQIPNLQPANPTIPPAPTPPPPVVGYKPPPLVDPNTGQPIQPEQPWPEYGKGEPPPSQPHGVPQTPIYEIPPQPEVGYTPPPLVDPNTGKLVEKEEYWQVR